MKMNVVCTVYTLAAADGEAHSMAVVPSTPSWFSLISFQSHAHVCVYSTHHSPGTHNIFARQDISCVERQRLLHLFHSGTAQRVSRHMHLHDFQITAHTRAATAWTSSMDSFPSLNCFSFHFALRRIIAKCSLFVFPPTSDGDPSIYGAKAIGRDFLVVYYYGATSLRIIIMVCCAPASPSKPDLRASGVLWSSSITTVNGFTFRWSMACNPVSTLKCTRSVCCWESELCWRWNSRCFSPDSEAHLPIL